HLLRDIRFCTFIIAVDQDVLISFIDKQYKDTSFNGARYLEKIFPDYYRISDPWVPFNRGETHRGLSDEVEAYLNSFDLLNGTPLDHHHRLIFWHAFAQNRVMRNPRRIKRIL